MYFRVVLFVFCGSHVVSPVHYNSRSPNETISTHVATSTIQIPKCCNLNEILKFESKEYTCYPASDGFTWSPHIYEDEQNDETGSHKNALYLPVPNRKTLQLCIFGKSRWLRRPSDLTDAAYSYGLLRSGELRIWYYAGTDFTKYPFLNQTVTENENVTITQKDFGMDDYCIDELQDGQPTEVVRVCIDDKGIVIHLASLLLMFWFVILYAIIFFLYVTLPIVAVLSWRVQTVHGKIFAVLFACEVVKGVEGNLSGNWPNDLCIFSVLVSVFSTASTYVWLAILNFDFWQTFRFLVPNSSSRRHTRYTWYSIVGWSTVGIITALVWFLMKILDFSDFKKSAFLPHDESKCGMFYAHVYILLPIALTFITLACTFSCLTMKSIRSYRKDSDSTPLLISSSKDDSSPSLFWKLAMLMGFTWLIQLIYDVVYVAFYAVSYREALAFYEVFDENGQTDFKQFLISTLVHTLIGLLILFAIFPIYCVHVLKPSVLSEVQKVCRICKICKTRDSYRIN